MLASIRIVLSHTSHAGNIGAAARAMKVMGLSELYLVNPRQFPHEEATAMASGADDLLAGARVVDSIESAIGDCALVVGASARTRSLAWPMLDPREFAAKAAEATREGPVALLFGTERTGLTNEELQRCHYHVYIPSNPDYSSLNLAQAVQILCYELRMASPERAMPAVEPESPKVGSADLERYFEHLERMLNSVDFIKAENPKPLMAKIRRLYYRAQPSQEEMNILRGMCKAVLDTVAQK
ncbi:MAG: tRNA (cytosine(32)/uridine(32)-2'-O)-methyltransferase TrmJ [Gammaproteobacteria bacterium]|nr:tRNA (cytosine(32)/uridine(32)-2'-O)-methyltransferase TrmJ [Gammaproteobacteria bacterium]